MYVYKEEDFKRLSSYQQKTISAKAIHDAYKWYLEISKRNGSILDSSWKASEVEKAVRAMTINLTDKEFLRRADLYHRPILVDDALCVFTRQYFGKQVSDAGVLNNTKFKDVYYYKNFCEGLVGLGVIYNKIVDIYNDQLARMHHGAKAENEAIRILKQSLDKDDVIFHGETIEDKNGVWYEHDVIIVSKKGIFTIEVKNYNADMVWDKNGDFTITKNGFSKDVVGNPYKQTMLHENSLKSLVDYYDKNIEGYVLSLNEDARINIDYKPAIGKIFTSVDAFLRMYDDKENVLGISDIKRISAYLKKNIVDGKKYNFIDMEAVDDYFVKLLQKLEFDPKMATREEYDARSAIGYLSSNIDIVNLVNTTRSTSYDKSQDTFVVEKPFFIVNQKAIEKKEIIERKYITKASFSSFVIGVVMTIISVALFVSIK